MKNWLRFGIMAALLAAAHAAHADAQKALVNSDYVRMREKPNKDAGSLGFLYKNMVVEIKSQSQAMDKIGKDAFYWYEVSSKEGSGWVYGKFLTPNAANWDVDTYDAPGDVDWLNKRFGESTWYDTQNMNMTSFSMDDYRNLMVAAANGNDRAWVALKTTILQHLKEEPLDANYAYLKKRLYSWRFMADVLIRNQVAAQDFFEYVPYLRDNWVAALKYDFRLARWVPGEGWQDKELVLLILNSPVACDPNNVANAQAMASVPEVRAALSRCRNRQ